MPVRFTVEHPVGQADCAAGLYGPEGLAEFARAAEEAGFDAVAFTEHPAPSLKWLRAGGHASLDPLAALAFCAATTSRIRLLTYLLVLPYRNPLLAAKTIATVDLLSGGRLTLGAGGGYLRSEFAALGADFGTRGALLDESLEVLRGLWSGESFGFDGRAFTAGAGTAAASSGVDRRQRPQRATPRRPRRAGLEPVADRRTVRRDDPDRGTVHTGRPRGGGLGPAGADRSGGPGPGGARRAGAVAPQRRAHRRRLPGRAPEPPWRNRGGRGELVRGAGARE
ncbi:TIGR03619 family F420-dependent LLM class oxidoreductase [Amycolatopsis sp.]|uniref:TIGR03619 family F420-dependent LLM class oxidoreductase n=1 Tax=Amycolatopsis sp. TaxID=37632 RepID=UPI0039C88DF0